MGVSKLDIYNAALLRIGQKSMASESDGSAASSVLSLQYPLAVREVLRMHNWTACLVRKALPQVGVDEELYPDLYGYALPSDWVRIAKVLYNSEEIFDWFIEGNVLFTTKEKVSLVYVTSQKTPDQWDELLTDAIILRLAYKIAVPVGGQAQLGQLLAQEYSGILAQAMMTSGRERKAGRGGDPLYSEEI